MSRQKTILVVIASVVGIAAIAALSVWVLENLNKHDGTNAPVVTTKASDITERANTLLTSTAATKDFTYLPAAEGQKESILVTNGSLALLSDTQSFVSFQKDATVSDSDVSQITSVVKGFFTDNGFNESNSIKASPTVKLRYNKDGVQCQFSHFVDDKNTNNGFKLTCTNDSDHTEEIALISQLVGLWKNPDAYDYLMQDGLTEGAVSVKTINTINTDDATKSHTLLYAKTNGEWVYVADATEGDPSLSNGKYIMNEDLKKGLADPTYGPLLKKYLSTAEKK